MTKAEADALLQQFRANPGDLETAETLRWYYRTRWEGQMPWEEAREALRFVWLSTIERHPESPSSEWGLSAAEDPDGHAQAPTLWDAHLTDSALSARAYRNAVRFIETTDPARAERLLIEAVTRYREPPLAAYASERGTETGKAGTEVWRSALGTLYARWASGAVRDHLGRPEIDEAAAASAFGRSARAALEVSTDAVLLTAAGQFLVSRIRGPNGEPGPAAPRELGYALLARALAIDPANDQARHWNDFERRLDDMRALRARVVERLGVEWNAATAAQVSTLPEEDQVELLPQLVSHHYSRAEMTGYYQKDQAGRMAQMATARDFAERALSVLRDRAAAGDRVAVDRLDDVEMLRGAIAWAFGDRERALRSLVVTIDLAKASGEYALEIGTYARQNLTHALLTAGEIDAVATHYEQAAPLSGRDQPQHAAIAKALREGRMPANYQRQLAGAVQ